MIVTVGRDSIQRIGDFDFREKPIVRVEHRNGGTVDGPIATDVPHVTDAVAGIKLHRVVKDQIDRPKEPDLRNYSYSMDSN